MGEEDEAVKGLMPTSSSSSEVGDALTKGKLKKFSIVAS